MFPCLWTGPCIRRSAVGCRVFRTSSANCHWRRSLRGARLATVCPFRSLAASWRPSCVSCCLRWVARSWRFFFATGQCQPPSAPLPAEAASSSGDARPEDADTGDVDEALLLATCSWGRTIASHWDHGDEGRAPRPAVLMPECDDEVSPGAPPAKLPRVDSGTTQPHSPAPRTPTPAPRARSPDNAGSPPPGQPDPEDWPLPRGDIDAPSGAGNVAFLILEDSDTDNDMPVAALADI